MNSCPFKPCLTPSLFNVRDNHGPACWSLPKLFPSDSPSPESQDPFPVTSGVWSTTQEFRPLSPKTLSFCSPALSVPPPGHSLRAALTTRAQFILQTSLANAEIAPHTRKKSTFRRMPLRGTRPTLSSSPPCSSHAQTSSAPWAIRVLLPTSPLRGASPL